MMKVSVIVPVYNDERRVKLCLQALLEQHFDGEYEILIIDNGSTPPLDLGRISDSRVRLLREQKPGSYAARNCGLAHATGSYIAFTDSDCLPQPDWLNALVKSLDRGIDMVAGEIRLFSANPEAPNAVECFDMLCGLDQREAVLRNHSAFTANLACRREVCEALGGFDGRATSGGDVAFTQAAVKSGFRLEYNASMLVMHPARDSLRAHRQKLRRVVSGAYSLRHSESKFNRTFYWRSILWGGVRPWLTAFKMLRSQRVKELRISDRLRAISVLFHNKYYMLWLRVGYRLGLRNKVYR
ncbi:glycosyltransferase [Ferrimonas gelatinilytica]|uniref:Glycosyltransferase 2-like domain-containing protein n=1 Tax=Ferrimonas gelatinilytica TaxID=1255257 RepID=A0ABP9SCV5_9GAMM